MKNLNGLALALLSQKNILPEAGLKAYKNSKLNISKKNKTSMEKNMPLQVGVKILLKNKEGRYLLVHRSLEKYPDVTGRWDIIGGRINPGTSLLDNLQREVKEETNLEIIGTPTLIAAQDIIKNSDFHVVRLTYIGEANGEVVLDIAENDQYQWYNWEELQTLENVDVYFKELLNNESLWKKQL
jgi:ADP-ribose pyrophosphatase YjhB (NUDIX family)